MLHTIESIYVLHAVYTVDELVTAYNIMTGGYSCPWKIWFVQE
jgi:hypothetical protein